ncbi:MAG: hypothetical protein IJY04_10625 [Clostridia bacterium]|nr:hypothetical protein [Clostridia bacterium]
MKIFGFRSMLKAVQNVTVIAFFVVELSYKLFIQLYPRKSGGINYTGGFRRFLFVI